MFGNSTAGGAYVPGHERLRRDDQGTLEGVPRRAAAGEDGHRRGQRRREPRRRRDARSRSAASPTTSPSTSSTPSASAARSCKRLNHRKRRPGPAWRRAATAATTPSSCSASRRADPKVPFDPRDVIARIVDDSDFDEFKPLYGTVAGHRLRRAARLPDRHPRQPPRRAVQRGEREGGAVHPARQPDRHAAGVPAEHHRLHGGQGVRAARHHQGRREDDQRRLQQPGAAPHHQHGRLVRRRQLRHVRAGVRAALPVRLAEREDRRDGARSSSPA